MELQNLALTSPVSVQSISAKLHTARMFHGPHKKSCKKKDF